MLLREAVEEIWKEHVASNESRKREIFGKGLVLRKDVKLILSGKIEETTDTGILAENVEAFSN
jgi:hypothetical protein